MNHSHLYKEIGFGLGLRKEHYTDILDKEPDVDWFEILTENYLVPGGKPRYYLDRIRERYPVVMHGVSMSIGGTDPLNIDYLQQVRTLADEIQPKWISDHLCWTGIDGINAHDLLPLPYTSEAVRHVASRVRQAQEILDRRILLENVSSYVTYKQSEMSEWEFLSAIAEEADCLILLDINNVFVSAVNHEFNPLDYLDGVPAGRVQQHHLAGHTDEKYFKIDTHDAPVTREVWDLYAEAVRRFPGVSTIIERDDDIPGLDVLLNELEQAKTISNGVLNG